MALTIMKIGGQVTDDAAALEAFLHDFASLPSPKILVHGGGKQASTLSRQLGIEPRMVEGRRITDKATLDVVTMAYAGLNKRVVALLQREGCNAIGLTGADANVIPAVRRSAVPIDFGYVGDIDPTAINTVAIAGLIGSGLTPVFCALTHDGKGSLLNSNADTVASSLAVAMAQRETVDLVYCFEHNGVLRDPADEASVITDISQDAYAALKQKGIVSKGMIPKLDNAFAALRSRSGCAGVRQVIIRSYKNLTSQGGTSIHL